MDIRRSRMKNEHLKKTSHIGKISDLMQEYRKSHTDLTPIKKHSGAKPRGIYICGKFYFIWNAAKHLHHHTDVKKHPDFCRARTAH